jgi:hypothetical protein
MPPRCLRAWSAWGVHTHGGVDGTRAHLGRCFVVVHDPSSLGEASRPVSPSRPEPDTRNHVGMGWAVPRNLTTVRKCLRDGITRSPTEAHT